MTDLRTIQCPKGEITVETAECVRDRTKGLLGRASLDPDHGLLIPGCSSVHTLFMKFAIDLVYLDIDMNVLRVVANVRPFRLSWCPGADSVLELSAGAAARCGLVQDAQLRDD